MQCLNKNELIRVYILLILVLILLVFILWLLLACIICPWALHELQQYHQDTPDRGLDSPSSYQYRALESEGPAIGNSVREGFVTREEGKTIRISGESGKSGTKKIVFI